MYVQWHDFHVVHSAPDDGLAKTQLHHLLNLKYISQNVESLKNLSIEGRKSWYQRFDKNLVFAFRDILIFYLYPKIV